MRLEDAGHDIFWYAIAIVLHRDGHTRAIARRVHTNMTRVGESGILQKIQHNLPEIVGPSHS